MRRSLTANIAANVAGRSYTAFCGIVFVPVYLHFLGVESYGLFALLNSYMTVAFLLDIGFSGALARDTARLAESAPGQMRDLVWSISLPYCAVAFALALAFYLATPWIAPVILHDARDMHQPMILTSVGFAGIALALQLPIFLFMGGLSGLQRQDLTNGINVVSTTLRYGGSVFLLWSFPGSVAILMIWQAIVAVLTAVAALAVLWCHLPSNHRRPRFQPALLRDLWQFAVGMGGTTFLGMLVFQSDKMFVGTLLPLREVGIYMVASVIATNLMMLAQPIAAAAFPRLAQLYARTDAAAIRATFRKVSQLVGVTALPVAILIAFFPRQTLAIWTGNLVVAADAAPVLRLLVIGVSCNALGSIPYNMILAAGRVRSLLVLISAICVAVLPLLYFLTAWAGMIGTAAGMLAYQLAVLIACAAILHSLLGNREWWRWITVAVLVPQILILLTAAIAKTLAPAVAPRETLFLMLAAAWLAASVVSGLAMPSLRNELLSYLRRLRGIVQAAN